MKYSQILKGSDPLSGHEEVGFDAEYYLKHYAHELQGLKPYEHYMTYGEASGYKPNLVFDPDWYGKKYYIQSSAALLDEYLREGEICGRQPSVLIDIEFLKSTYADLIGDCSVLEFYLRNRRTNEIKPNVFFDPHFYCSHNPDVASAEVEPYEHFVEWGVFEGRRGSPNFDAEHVWQSYLNNNRSINPFIAFLEHHEEFGWTGTRQTERHSVSQEQKRSVAPSEHFEPDQVRHSGVIAAKTFALYLTQFHAIPENDLWWGDGFTEWTNLVRGSPRFVGHVQPKVPRDLGFYDLTNERIIHRQVELAQKMGLFGFCFYYYNFDGKRLLEKPLDLFVKTNKARFPFCLMWANENWTRRWDGMENDVLIAQTYNQLDEFALVADLAAYMADDAYYKIDGRPLLFCYRADIIPNCASVLARWRKIFSSRFSLNPLFIMAQTFGNIDPRPFNFDAAVEFPPHKYGSTLPQVNHDLAILDDDFKGSVRSYDDLVSQSLADYPEDYKLIKTVVPGWDNDARKQGSGMVIHGATPEKFNHWLTQTISKLETNRVFGEKILMINAWNEWCEGAYLEPDTHYGFAFANAFARAISSQTEARKSRIILVGHDAFPAGAQELLLNIGMTLKQRFGVDVTFVLMGGGPLVKSYSTVAATYVVDTSVNFWADLNGHLSNLVDNGFRHAITNSIFSGNIVDSLVAKNIRITSLIHELPRIISNGGGEGHLRRIFAGSNSVVFPNAYVHNTLVSQFGLPACHSSVRAQGMYKSFTRDPGNKFRTTLGISESAFIVLNVGYADLRKGVDLFVALARMMNYYHVDIHFVWVGARDPAVSAWLASDLPNLHFVGSTEDVGRYYQDSDLLFLSSREDPFPSVVMEALFFGLPVVAFQDGGGAAELLADPRLGTAIPFGDLVAASQCISAYAAKRFDPEVEADSDFRKEVVAKRFDFVGYCADLLQLSRGTKRISVVVPNYNYARYLEHRMTSIFEQTYPVFEIIVLDDASSDDSVAALESIARDHEREFVLIENDQNSGNVFRQWKAGLEAAKGDFIWIAEADDLSDSSFLERMIQTFEQPSVIFSFCDSRAVNERGEVLYESYKGYYQRLSSDALQESCVVPAGAFLESFLSVRNLILNASSILWRADALRQAFDKLGDQRIDELQLAGDWKIYATACLQDGNVIYVSDALNIHRRHCLSVTGNLDPSNHVEEIRDVHNYINELVGHSRFVPDQISYAAEVSIQLGLSDHEN